MKLHTTVLWEQYFPAVLSSALALLKYAMWGREEGSFFNSWKKMKLLFTAPLTERKQKYT